MSDGGEARLAAEPAKDASRRPRRSRGERAQLASAMVAMAAALTGGLQRFDAGQPRQGIVMVSGALIGAIVLIVRYRARRRAAAKN